MQSTLSSIMVLLLVSSHVAYGFFRMPAGQPLVIARVDPIEYPGVKSPHVHSVNGGNGFSPNSTFDDLRKSTCTTNLVTEDKSNYWVPKLYFHDRTNNSYISVPNGGLLVYYLQRPETGERITAFPAGFRMVTGNNSKRARNWPQNIRDLPQWNNMTLAEQQDALTELSITWTCFGKDGFTNSAMVQNHTSAFPSIDCPNGFRSELFFPSCWDGKYLDSPDHQSHVAYPDRHDNGVCPPDYPVRLPSVFFEHTWDIGVFSSLWNKEWPFEWGMQDSTGWSFHGDIQNGWDVDILQQAMDKCTNNTGVIESCEVFTSQKLLQTPKKQDACKIKDPFNEHADGIITSLPDNGHPRPNGTWVPVNGK